MGRPARANTAARTTAASRWHHVPISGIASVPISPGNFYFFGQITAVHIEGPTECYLFRIQKRVYGREHSIKCFFISRGREIQEFHAIFLDAVEESKVATMFGYTLVQNIANDLQGIGDFLYHRFQDAIDL